MRCFVFIKLNTCLLQKDGDDGTDERTRATRGTCVIKDQPYNTTPRATKIVNSGALDCDEATSSECRSSRNIHIGVLHGFGLDYHAISRNPRIHAS